MPQRDLRTVPVTTLANGHNVELFVHTIAGDRPGPRLALTSGVHGDEPLAVETVRRVLDAVAGDESLRGQVTAVPVANAYAHMALTRNTPVDGVNLNRIFPGVADGSLTEQVAHTLTELLVGQVDYLVDFHSGGNLACVDYAYIHEDGADLSKAYGTKLLYAGPGYPGSLTAVTREAGIPSVVSELGGGSQRIEHYLDQGVAGTLNLMRHLDMIDGDAQKTEGQRIVDELVILRPHTGGILLSEVGPEMLGEEIPKGSVLGRIVNPHTFAEQEVLRAPFNSIVVLSRVAYTNVEPGDYGFMLANADTAVAA